MPETLLHKAFSKLQKQKKVSTMKAFADDLGYNYTYISGLMNGKRELKSKVFELIKNVYEFDALKEYQGIYDPHTFTLYDNSQINNIQGKYINPDTKGHLQNVDMFSRVNGVSMNSGIIFVPISLHREYCEQRQNQDFMKTLPTLSIEGLPYTSEHRNFEVPTDNLSPHYNIGDRVFGAPVNLDAKAIPQYFPYIIVTDSEILIGQIFRKGNGDYVLISEDEEAYPQRLLEKNEVKELWKIEGYINMQPPKLKKPKIKI